eukprot:446630-Pyramimonas_sp.AAC.1
MPRFAPRRRFLGTGSAARESDPISSAPISAAWTKGRPLAQLPVTPLLLRAGSDHPGIPTGLYHDVFLEPQK